MDHLKSSEERKNRWYARHLSPKFVPVVPAHCWEDLWRTTDEHGVEKYRNVKALPFSWLAALDSNKKEQAKDHITKALDCHGFLVVSSVLSSEDCEKAMDLAWDWLEAASSAEKAIQCSEEFNNKQTSPKLDDDPPVCRRNPETLSSPCFPVSLEGGMMPFYGSGHSTFAWFIRSHPNVRRVYEAMYGDGEKLLTSLDGIVLWRSDDSDRKDQGWFHLDQNPRHKPVRECIQGLVNLLPVNPDTGGNALVAKSHQHFPQHFLGNDAEKFNKGTSSACLEFYRQRLNELGDEDWMEIDPQDDELLDPSKILSCMLQPGDVLMWDSRTVHCSYPARRAPKDKQQESDGDNPSLIRAATLVTMMPASTKGITEQFLKARKDAIIQSRTLTHWANKVALLGEENREHVKLEKARVSIIKDRQDRKGDPAVLLELSDLSEEQFQLVAG